MTPPELDILLAWQREKHEETMARFDRIESRMDRTDSRIERLEDAPILTAAKVARLERTADRFEAAAKWLSPKRVAIIASLPGSGGAVYFLNWITHILR